MGRRRTLARYRFRPPMDLVTLESELVRLGSYFGS